MKLILSTVVIFQIIYTLISILLFLELPYIRYSKRNNLDLQSDLLINDDYYYLYSNRKNTQFDPPLIQIIDFEIK